MTLFGDLIKEAVRGYFFHQNLHFYQLGRIQRDPVSLPYNVLFELLRATYCAVLQ